MSDLRVEKTPAAVQLLLIDGDRLDGTLFLSSVAPAHDGPQSVAELMAEVQRMLPFHNAAGDFVLIGKASIAAVGVRDGTCELPWVQKIPLRAHLAGGHVLRGSYLAEEGMGMRLSDALNGDEPWFRLEQEDILFWIAKHHLFTVEPEHG